MISSSDITSLDASDGTLLALLRQNARHSVAELSRALGISRASVYARIERLERRGIIAGYTVRLGEAFARRRIRAHVLMKISGKKSASIEARLGEMQNVMTLHAISGEYDLIGVIEAGDLNELNALIDAIAAIDGVERTHSPIILSTKISR